MKWLGLTLIFLCLSMGGALQASRLAARVRIIEECLRMLGWIYDRLQYLAADTRTIVEQLAADVQFKGLDFLYPCSLRLKKGETFPQAWRQSLMESVCLMDKERDLMLSLGSTLGATSLEGQLAAVSCTRQLMEGCLEEAKGILAKSGKLYRNLGILGGLMAVIILM